MIEFYKKQKQLMNFLATIVGLYAVWFFVYECWIGPNDYIDTWLSKQVAHAGAWSLDLIGYNTGVQNTTIVVNGKPTVYIANSCNSLVLMATFIALVGAFPGDPKKKFFFIPVGVVGIYLINVLRVGALALNHLYSQGTVDFNHKYTFSFVVYSFIFAMWVLWVKKYSTISLNEEVNFSHA